MLFQTMVRFGSACNARVSFFFFFFPATKVDFSSVNSISVH